MGKGKKKGPETRPGLFTDAALPIRIPAFSSRGLGENSDNELLRQRKNIHLPTWHPFAFCYCCCCCSCRTLHFGWLHLACFVCAMQSGGGSDISCGKACVQPALMRVADHSLAPSEQSLLLAGLLPSLGQRRMRSIGNATVFGRLTRGYESASRMRDTSRVH
ncbi:hypothetical protein LY76DRAFT_71604 [Colletotrichum caudatum]|nr:hypothetical protein LY76DRAFT_71604 [Colletotrichum caudatum]